MIYMYIRSLHKLLHKS